MFCFEKYMKLCVGKDVPVESQVPQMRSAAMSDPGLVGVLGLDEAIHAVPQVACHNLRADFRVLSDLGNRDYPFSNGASVRCSFFCFFERFSREKCCLAFF